jgi:hypothetical protein
MPRVAVGVALSTPKAKYMQRAALGVDFATPTAMIRRGSDCWLAVPGHTPTAPTFGRRRTPRLSAYVAIPVV